MIEGPNRFSLVESALLPGFFAIYDEVAKSYPVGNLENSFQEPLAVIILGHLNDIAASLDRLDSQAIQERVARAFFIESSPANTQTFYRPFVKLFEELREQTALV